MTVIANDCKGQTAQLGGRNTTGPSEPRARGTPLPKPQKKKIPQNIGSYKSKTCSIKWNYTACPPPPIFSYLPSALITGDGNSSTGGHLAWENKRFSQPTQTKTQWTKLWHRGTFDTDSFQIFKSFAEFGLRYLFKSIVVSFHSWICLIWKMFLKKRQFLFFVFNFCFQSFPNLELSCCKKQQKKSKPRNWFGEYGTSEGSEWYQIDPKWLRG